MSLSAPEIMSILQKDFVCGYKDISNKKYAGASGKHMPDENAVDTTNGAGPHNIQIFVLAPDGTVMHCLPGYWHPQDLASELAFSQKIYALWQDPGLSLADKRVKFSEMNLAHAQSHDKGERARSHMQGFDLQYEAKNNPGSDFFYNARAIDPATGKTPGNNVKTVDQVMHERMAARPFVPYEKFDVATYSTYGKLLYDKHEQYRTADGSIPAGSDLSSEPMIGNTPRAHPIKTQAKKTGNVVARTALNQFMRYGIRALMR